MLLRIAVAGLLGASLGPASPRPDAPDQAPAQAPPRTADQLIARFRKAHESRAIATILGLIYWGNAEPEMHRTMERNIAADFGLAIKGIALQPLAKDQRLEYTRNGVLYRPTLRPVGQLKVEFLPEPGKDQQLRSSSYLVGIQDGVYFLLTAAPVPR